MTNAIGQNLSLLASLLKGPVETVPSSDEKSSDQNFAVKLESVLANNSSDALTAQTKAASLAEALNLQMLRTTLTLAGDDPTTSSQPIFPSQSPSLQALVKAYSSTQPEQENSAPATDHVSLETDTLPLKTDQPTRSVAENSWLDPIISKASRHFGVDIGLIKAVIKAESNFNPTAVSHAGARGLMQLMPATARSLGVNDSFDPEQNVMAGTRFLKDLLKRYNGNVDSALAAYNWGPGNVDRRPDHLPRETRDYLARVKQLYSTYSA